MTDRPVREPEPSDPRLDRDGDGVDDASSLRPTAAEGEDDATGGQRPPRPSQAEGERSESSDDAGGEG